MIRIYKSGRKRNCWGNQQQVFKCYFHQLVKGLFPFDKLSHFTLVRVETFDWVELVTSFDQEIQNLFGFGLVSFRINEIIPLHKHDKIWWPLNSLPHSHQCLSNMHFDIDECEVDDSIWRKNIIHRFNINLLISNICFRYC